MPLSESARSDLTGLRDVSVREDDDALRAVAQDQSHLSALPAVVLRPEAKGAVVPIVRWARRHRVPLVARGAGTSLEGESVPPAGGAVVDLSSLGRILEVDATDRVARVEPGVVNHDLHIALAPHRMFFPPNPGSWRSCTIGGNLATNASGPRSFKYGPTRHWVRSAEVVLGTGEIVTMGSRASKRSIGPDLLQLLIGSEGTLGVIVEATLAMAPRPERRMGLILPVPPQASLGRLVAALRPLVGDGLSAIEYLDAECAAALGRMPGHPLPMGDPLVLLEIESADEAEEERRVDRLVAALRSVGISADPTVAPDADRMWSRRGESGVALDRELGSRVREDIAVPVSRLDEMLNAVEEIARAEGVRSVTFAHLGDGNLHPNLGALPGTEQGERIRGQVIEACLRLGGTISGEHGIGALKNRYLGDQVGVVGLSLLRAMKSACDPDGILNPGKLYPVG